MEKEIEILCKNICYLRRVHGLSKKEMANKLGIGIYSLTKLESGILPPRLTTNVLLRIYDVFGIKPAKMFLPLGAQWEQQ